MKLLLDVGNTRIKWLVTAADAPQADLAGARGALPRAASPQVPELASAPTAVWVSSVAGGDWEAQLADLCRAQWSLDPWFARAADELLGLKNSYSEPDRMGVDRWLAMLAAWRRQQGAVCVIDAGSALTIDLLADDGSHRGGYILPGLESMERALLSDTARVRFADAPRDSLEPGRSTEQAVYNGLLLSQAGAVHLALDRFAQDCPVIFCGGNGMAVRDALQLQGEVIEDLVFEGLLLAGTEQL